MIKYDEVVDMTVLSTKEGKHLGKISRIAVDLKDARVVGFLVQDRNEGKRLLPVGNVTTYGRDVVMASSANDLEDLSNLSVMAKAAEFGEKIVGLNIVTKNGEDVGKIGAFCFDKKSGLITHYETSEGAFSDLMEGRGLLSRDGVCALSLDALVVTETSIRVSDIMKTGPGIKHKLDKIIYKTERRVKEATKKLQGIVKIEDSDTSFPYEKH
jgi:uncharacterized protein YrrD